MGEYVVNSICSIFPTSIFPNQGIFVHRRVNAMARLVRVRGVQPQPFFPLLKPYRLQSPMSDGCYSIEPIRMLYIPKIGSFLNGSMLSRCLVNQARRLDLTPDQCCILDAHFGYPEGVGCYRVGKKLNLPVFITIRGLERQHFGTAIGDQIIEALNGCTGVIAVGESLRDAAIEAGADPNNITVIPNGIDHLVFRPGEAQSADTIGGLPTLVSVGNLKHVKGQDVLLNAFHRLIQKRPARLIMIGGDDEPRYAAKQRAFVTSHGLEEQVQFTGSLSQSEISHWLQQASLFVLASRREGCCNAVLEALACGVPVVATEVGDNHRYVLPGVNGILVPAEDACALALAMERAIDKTYDKFQISETVASLTWENTAKQVLRYFEQRLAQRPRDLQAC